MMLTFNEIAKSGVMLLVGAGLASGYWHLSGPRGAPAPSSAQADGTAARFIAGIELQKAGNEQGALAAYAESARMAADVMARSHFNMGVIHQQAKRHAQAVQAYEKVLGLDPQFAGATYNLAFAYRDSGQDEKAVDTFIKANALEPGNSSALYFGGQLAEKLGRIEQAKGYYSKAISINPNLEVAKQSLAKLEGSGR